MVFNGDNSFNMQKSVHNVGAQVHGDGSNIPQPSTLVSPSPSPNLLSANQCQQLISFLQSQIQGQAITSEIAPANSSSGSSDFHPSFSGMFSLTPFVASYSHSKSMWLIDTGATHHVRCSTSQFNKLTTLSKAFITLPNSQQVPISSVGTVQLTPNLILDSIFHVPSFSYNLLSVTTLTSSSNCSVSFTHDHCVIQDASKGMSIGMGRRIGNLYVLEPAQSSVSLSSSSLPSVSSVINSDIWHCRLGHLGSEKLKLLSSSIPMKNVTNKICEVCPLAKQKRLCFPHSDSIATSVFDLIHCDIWGPFTLVTVLNEKYFLTIVDDCSRFVWTYLLKQKMK